MFLLDVSESADEGVRRTNDVVGTPGFAREMLRFMTRDSFGRLLGSLLKQQFTMNEVCPCTRRFGAERGRRACDDAMGVERSKQRNEPMGTRTSAERLLRCSSLEARIGDETVWTFSQTLTRIARNIVQLVKATCLNVFADNSDTRNTPSTVSSEFKSD